MPTIADPVQPLEHARLVYSIARRFRAAARINGMDPADLEQDGLVALLHAARTFDPARGRFGTYAHILVRQAIARSLTAWRRRDPIARRREEGAERVDETGLLAAGDTDPTARTEVEELLARLNPGDRQAITAYYGLDGAGERTLEQVGAELGVTKERVRQRLERGLAKLRAAANRQSP